MVQINNWKEYKYDSAWNYYSEWKQLFLKVRFSFGTLELSTYFSLSLDCYKTASPHYANGIDKTKL